MQRVMMNDRKGSRHFFAHLQRRFFGFAPTIQLRAGVQASRRVTEHDRPVKPNGIAANKCPEPNRMREWLRLLRNASDRIPRSVSARESPQAFARGCRR